MAEKESLVAKVWEHCPSRYGGTALLVLLKIAGLSVSKGYAFPSMEFLTKACGVKNRRSVQYIIKSLKKDGMLKTKRGLGGRHRFYLQVEEIEKLPLAVPRNYGQNSPEESAATTEQSVAGKFATQLEMVIRRDIPDAVIPDDWQTTWPGQIQKLLDAGHSIPLLVKVAQFAIKNPAFSVMHLGPYGAKAFVEHFNAMHRLCNNSLQEKAA
jgi:Helix-turn-helix domain